MAATDRCPATSTRCCFVAVGSLDETAALGVKQPPALGSRPPLRHGDRSQARRGAYANARPRRPDEPSIGDERN